MTDLRDAALAYASRGWSVFPVEPKGKRPLGKLVPHGLKDATTDPDVVRRWWRTEPSANVGLPTGIHFDVLDVDGAEGMEAINAARPADGPTIDGPTCHTGRGDHCYLAVTGLGNRAAVLDHVDFRGKGGYVVAPPSVHRSGTTYTWMPGWAPEHQPILPAPAWLLDLLRQPERAAHPAAVNRNLDAASAYGRAALEREVGRVMMAAVGERNHTLNKAAYNLGQLVAAGALELATVIAALEDVGQRTGLEFSEVRATIKSGLMAGTRSPRQVPQ
jgi:hypothetical protein